MNRKLLVALAATSTMLAVPGAALAGRIPMGVATGGLMIYYNNVDVTNDNLVSGFDENPLNQAYVQAHFGYSAPGYAGSNTNGMGFQFAPLFQSIFSGLPPGQSQFGLDLYGKAPTYTNAGGVSLPTVQFADNVDNTVAGATKTTVSGDQAWAINDYKEPTFGPANASNEVVNSLFRGTGFDLTIDNFVVTNDTDSDGTSRPRYFTIDVSGRLHTDGLVHWYNPALTDSSIAGYGALLGVELKPYLLFEGTLTLDSFYGLNPWGTAGNTYDPLWLENGSDQRDFYAGQLNLYFATPEPGSAALLALGLVGFAIARRRRV